MKNVTLYFKLLLLFFREGAHLKALYDLRHALNVWALVIFIIAIAEFVTTQIGIPMFMLAAFYAYVLSRIAYVFGINENANEDCLEEGYSF